VRDNDTTGRESDGSFPRLGRRPFLGSIGALGAAGLATGPGSAAAQDGSWPDPDDPYYSTLVEDLSEMDLPAGEFVYADDEAGTFDAYSATGTDDYAETEELDVSGDDVPFSEAIRFDVNDQWENSYDVNFRADVEDRPVEEGEVLLAVVYLRSPTDGAEVNYHARYDAEYSNEVANGQQPTLGSDWERYYFRIDYSVGADAGNWWTELWLAYGEQTVDIGGLALLSFGTDANVDDLPAWDDMPEQITEWPDVDDPYYSTLVEDLSEERISPGEFVYAEDEADAAAAYEVVGEDLVEVESIDPGADVPFSEARRIEVTGSVENPWDVGLKGIVEDRAVENRDVLLGVAYLRSPDGGEASLQYTAKDEANESTNMVLDPRPLAGGEWERYYFPIEFDYGADPGTWWTEFFLGYEGQTIDVGGLALLYFAQDNDPRDLPTWDTAGSETAEWEADAEERIEEYRTAELEVDVTDPDGNPVESVEVDVQQQSHEFTFGTAIDAGHLVDETSEGDEYREQVTDLFNTVVLGNHHKWRFWEEERETSDAATQWALDQGMDVRGHVCLWAAVSSWAVPTDVVSAMGVEWPENGVDDPELDPEHVRQRSFDHVRDIIEHYGEDIAEWEVVNELIHQPGFVEAINGGDLDDVDLVEAPVLREWFSEARDAAPEGTPLAINDYNTLAGNYRGTRDDYERQLEYIKGGDAGLDSVGVQCHFSRSETLTHQEIMDGLDRYADHDVRLKITEFDMSDDSWDEADKADFFHRFLKTAFSHEAVDDFLVWGITDPLHWQDDAPFFDGDWNPKPSLDVYRDLVFDEWWTNSIGQTDGDGRYTTDAYKGEYEVVVRKSGEDSSATTTVSDDGGSVELTLDVDASGSGGADGADSESDGLPGFGIAAGLLALASAGVALGRGTDDQDGPPDEQSG